MLFSDFRIKKSTPAVLLLLCAAVFFLSVYPQPLQAQQGKYAALVTRINFEAASTNAASLLEAVQKQTDYVFTFEKSELQAVQLQHLHFKKSMLGDLLTYLETQVGLMFYVNNKNIAVSRNPDFRKPAPPVQKKEPGRLTGTIIDEENGHAIAGATITINGKGTTTDMDGSFSIPLSKGMYTATVSYIGYTGKEISEIEISDKQTLELNITLKRSKGSLAAVMVKGSAKKESVNALLSRQKKAAEITSGISAEQIARTPDKHIGESLKRISGVSTTDNKYVVIRGISERYNTAMLDGVVLPSTEAEARSFSFDLIPSNLVSEVVVSKTITPDMNVSFGGGLIRINTMDIPAANFTTVSAGISVNDLTNGKDFYSRKRGSYDFLGFDDGHRGIYPKSLRATGQHLGNKMTPQEIAEQNRQFGSTENFETFKYKARPSQNYQVSLGRVIKMKNPEKNSMGVVASVSYRNTQSISPFDNLNRGKWWYFEDSTQKQNIGAIYTFNTTLGGILNIGYKFGKNHISLRNTYTHLFEDAMFRFKGWHTDANPDQIPLMQENNDPIFLSLLQNKLSGIHQAGKIKLEWSLARVAVDKKEKDVTFLSYNGKVINGNTLYTPFPGVEHEPKEAPMSRALYTNRERNYSGNISAAYDFNLGKTKNTFKTGYAFTARQGEFKWSIAPFTVYQRWFNDSLLWLPVSQWGNHMNDSSQFLYAIPLLGDGYKGESQSHAVFAMFDNRLLNNLRLVWGARAEYYEYKEIHNAGNTKMNYSVQRPDKKWRLMPSANLTYSPIKNVNVRAAWSISAVRPELMDNSNFSRYNPYLNGEMHSRGVVSTIINHYDAKLEWYPGAGEIVSVGAFYKHFDKPIELIANVNTGNIEYMLQNSNWAKVKGIEFEFRKHLGFISNAKWLSRIFLFGNLTLLESQVESRQLIKDEPEEWVVFKSKRALAGQVPVLANAGIQYNGTHIGFNIAYNYAGYKTNVISEAPHLMDMERPREQLDIQVSYSFLHGKMLAKLNAGNLLDAAFRYYRNTQGMKLKDNVDPNNKPTHFDWNDIYEWAPGYSLKYDEGDQSSFTKRIGRSLSFSLSYNF